MPLAPFALGSCMPATPLESSAAAVCAKRAVFYASDDTSTTTPDGGRGGHGYGRQSAEQAAAALRANGWQADVVVVGSRGQVIEDLDRRAASGQPLGLVATVSHAGVDGPVFGHEQYCGRRLEKLARKVARATCPDASIMAIAPTRRTWAKCMWTASCSRTSARV